MDFYFQPFSYINQIQNKLDKTIEQQTVSIFSSTDNSINVSFLLKNNQNTANIVLHYQESMVTNNNNFKNQKKMPIIMNFKGDAIVLWIMKELIN